MNRLHVGWHWAGELSHRQAVGDRRPPGCLLYEEGRARALVGLTKVFHSLTAQTPTYRRGCCFSIVRVLTMTTRSRLLRRWPERH